MVLLVGNYAATAMSPVQIREAGLIAYTCPDSVVAYHVGLSRRRLGFEFRSGRILI